MLTLTADADIISGMDILILDAIGANIFKTSCPYYNVKLS